MQERFNSLKEDLETRTQLESDARIKEAEGTGFKVRGLAARMESVEVSGKDDHKRINSVEQNITTMQTTAGQVCSFVCHQNCFIESVVLLIHYFYVYFINV